ncbi:Formate dehydrogenase O beta subunit [Caenispirillum salinarum AK4]|uniref:Formate dehydrogenase O beta subunit n=1 Tax=Caenispirillum salinarum AK4 TaxID=1238182 RepID=K9HJX9_9PROT|nr:4Fe-4S dicluster domain-containing protein [Caenispirillum salinarum]EKV28916.1 Formate dehydrogenase O beta subunit [Caenispirillum salinarum AK4]
MTHVHPRAADYGQSFLDGPIDDESELTAGVKIEPGKSYGFFTDTTLCIGCKACEVACKEWNVLPADHAEFSGMSYDNTRDLSAHSWRHVTFAERMDPDDRPDEMPPYQTAWLMMSDVCKHCDPAPCLESCPTGSLFRTEFDTVVVQQDICNGCGYCVPSCPFGVIDLSTLDGKAHKCTLCYDRLKGGLEPACSKACPTDSIQFGEITELHERADKRVEQLKDMGREDAYLYGAPDTPGATGGIEKLNAFFLLTDAPEVYNLPAAPSRSAERLRPALATGLAAFAGVAAVAAVLLGGRRKGR